MSFSRTRRSVFAARHRPAGAPLALLLLAVSALGGCGVPREPRPEPAGPSPAATAAPATPAPVAATPAPVCEVRCAVDPVVARPEAPPPALLMLAYADRVRSMTGAELAAEIGRLGESGDAPPRQMQLAIALANTRVPADLARALGLLQRVIASPSGEATAIQPLARVLAARYLEQRRIEDDRDRQAQQLRESQRRIDQLNDRIEALRAIERSFARPLQPPQPPATLSPLSPLAPPAPGGAKPAP